MMYICAMKKILFSFILMGLLSGLIACDNTSEPKNEVESIQRKWTLFKTENRSENYESKEFSGQPIEIIMSLDNNGYFIIYDTFLDPKFEGAGINKIQQRSKGQWSYEDDILKLHHITDDTAFTEILKITSLDSKELVVQGENDKKNIYRTYNKR